MKKRSEEKENHKKERRDKEWDYVSIHTDQLSDSKIRWSKGRSEDKKRNDEPKKNFLEILIY